MQDKMKVIGKLSSNVSSTDSKKDTEASIHDHKSDFSKITSFENQDGSEIDQNGQIELDFGPDSKLTQLFNAEMMSQIESPNEMSYPGMKQSCSDLFNINQVSDNSHIDNDTIQGDDDEMPENNFSQDLVGSKKHPEDDIGLRVDSHKRRSFAQNALYRSESKIFLQDSGYGSEDDCISESCELEHCYSHESSMNFSNVGQFQEPSNMLRSMSN